MVQWLRLRASNAGGTGSIPGWGTNIPHAVQTKTKKQKNKKEKTKKPKTTTTKTPLEITKAP